MISAFKDSRFHEPIKIGDETFFALLDTGASRSYMNETVYNEILKQGIAEMKPANMIARFADGRRTNIAGIVDLKLIFNGKKINITFRILPNSDSDLLFGIDILTATSYQFDFDKMASTVSESVNNKRVNVENALKIISDDLKTFVHITEPTNSGKHFIKLKNSEPINFNYTPRNPAMLKVINDEVNDMLEKNVIEPSNSPWCSPIVIVKRKDKSYRFCIDFPKINAV